MRRRYFSPELRDTLDDAKKLRWVGSTSKLPNLPAAISDDEDQKIGDYVYSRSQEIGRGYSSRVYKARKMGSTEVYAVKVIELKKYTNSNMEMLSNQIQIIKTLAHPNVLRCHDIYRTANKCYIVTEYCPYGDLLGHISKRGKLSEQEAIDIMRCVVGGCRYLMENNIIHRDLKPANILKSKEGWKIGDFGFAVKSVGDLKARYNVGTPLYMPPEALVQNLYSPKSDIFSIGIMLYELMVGCTPWESRTERDLVRKMTTVPFRIPDKYGLSASMKSLLRKMCAINYSDRMGQSEFLNLSLSRLDQVNPEQKDQIKKKEKSVELAKARLQHRSIEVLPRLKTVASNLSGGDIREALSKKTDTQNNHILINQLHYCRFLYYLVRNSHNVLLDAESEHRLGLLAFKHLMKVIKQLGDSSRNWLRLRDWDQFKRSKKYLNTHLTIKEYVARYEKEYLVYLKSLEVAVIRDINQEFIDFSNVTSFTQEFYTHMLEFIAPLIRNFNHNLALALADSEIFSKEEAGQVQALRSLLKYYRLIELSRDCFLDYEYFESHSAIKVHVDFKKVEVKKEEWAELREELKSI